MTATGDWRGRSGPVAVGPARTWARAGETYATGSADLAGTMLDAAGVAAAIDRCEPERLGALLASCNGHFAAVKETRDAVHAIVDHVRSIPLFVARQRDGRRSVTDDVEIATAAAGAEDDPDPGRLAELLISLVVTGPDTLLRCVSQVEAGSVQRVPRDPEAPTSVDRWYAFRPNVHPDPGGDLVEQGRATLFAALGRTIDVAGDELLVVPLSGGLDSRLLLHVLLQHDVDRDQVHTFTYGRPGSREAVIARTVAGRLGVSWEFVPYSPQGWRDLRRSASWGRYLRSGSSLAGVPNLADLPAILDMRARGTLPGRSLLLPGHTGDFLCGSWIPSLARRAHGTRRQVVESILVNHYRLRSHRSLGRLLGRPGDELAEILRARAEASIPPTPERLTREELVGTVEAWVCRERQAKYIVNAVRAYEHLGLRWWLPWWDREVVDFWETVPLEQRLGQPLRDRIAAAVGDDPSAGSWQDRLEKRAVSTVRRLGVETWAKRARTMTRRLSPGRAYHRDPLGWHGLLDEDRFRQWYTGREQGFAFLGEAVVEAFFDGALKA